MCLDTLVLSSLHRGQSRLSKQMSIASCDCSIDVLIGKFLIGLILWNFPKPANAARRQALTLGTRAWEATRTTLRRRASKLATSWATARAFDRVSSSASFHGLEGMCRFD